MPHLCFQLNKKDNVAIALHALKPGERLACGIVVRQEIPQGHKIALQPIPAGGAVIRYGVPLGTARCSIAAGDYVGEHNLEIAPPPDLHTLRWGTDLIDTDRLPIPPADTFLGYPYGSLAGTRNLLGITS